MSSLPIVPCEADKLPLHEDLWGEICEAYHERGEAPYSIRREDGHVESDHSPEVYFAEPDEFFPWESDLLTAARGPILDVGSGPGRMMLWAQEAGHRVVGIEASPRTVRVAMERGAHDVRLGRWQDLDTLLEPGERDFACVLLMGHNPGLAGDLEGFEQLLSLLHGVTAPEAALLLTSIDFLSTSDPKHLALQRALGASGRYPGAFRIRVEFEGCRGSYFPWLLVAPGDLARVARATGWRIERLEPSGEGHYGAVLRRSDDG